MRFVYLLLGIALGSCGGNGTTKTEASGGGGGSGGRVSGGNGGAVTGGSGGTALSGGSGGAATGGADGRITGGTGGAITGGSGGITGGSGGTSTGGRAACRDVNDCGTSSRSSFYECVPPGESPEQGGGCGAPDWCGQCSCPPQPPQAFGGSESCSVDADCPNAASDPGHDLYASYCGSLGTCVVCRDDGDCPSDVPRCATDAQGHAACFECTSAADCSGATPACDVLGSNLGATGGSCVVCGTTADCATGICVANACVDQCMTDADCGSPGIACIDARCVPEPCVSPSDCPTHFLCGDGFCSRSTCQSDADCGEGTCVQARCYDALGSCYEHFAIP